MTLSALALVWLPPNPSPPLFCPWSFTHFVTRGHNCVGHYPRLRFVRYTSLAMSPKNWELARGGHLRDTCTQRSAWPWLFPVVSACRTGEQNTSRQMASRSQSVVGVTPPGVVARTVAVAGAKTKGPATSLDGVETRVLQTPARYAGAELPPVDMAAELVPAGSKTVPQPPQPARSKATTLKRSTSLRLKGSVPLVPCCNRPNPQAYVSWITHPSLKGPQNPEMASLTKMVEITQADSPLRVGPPRCETEIVVFPHLVGVQKGGGWYYQQTPRKMTSVTGKRQSFGDSNNSTASKRSRTAPRLASPPLRTRSTSSMMPCILHASAPQQPLSILLDPAGALTNAPADKWRQDPISAARADMVAFNKEVRKGSATSFAKAVTRANRRQSNKELEARCGPMRDRSANGLLPDDEEDIAATQAFAQGTVPVLVVAKIHLFAYALVEGIYQTRATFMKWAEMIHEETWGLVLPNLPYVAATTSELEVLVNYLATLRGKSKDRLRPIIPNIHPFLHRIATPHDLQANIDVYNGLHPNGFHCTSTNPRQGHYESPDMGVSLDLFLPMARLQLYSSSRSISLWQFCLEEWKGGYWESKELSAGYMLDKYKAHLAGLKKLVRLRLSGL
ncbi:hypothetical protein RHS01_02173 [Rhizoctonia solani]|uniref:Uncharacterized protein n=1 Tax=Rhizoctonia solani TaxID=456999 RepID=A0A8H7IN98_9AGAM|nr:hypothetical protein RHS01_02173 [Rhizoctonia solani]